MKDLKPGMLTAAVLALLTPAAAYKRIAAAVPGTVVGNSDFAGGRIGAYPAIAQEQNPLFQELKLTMECCYNFRSLADEIAHKINVNEIHGDDAQMEGEILSKYKDKCSKVGALDSLKQGSSECSYTFVFTNAQFHDFRFQATCVPAQMCATNVAGMTDGRIVLYGVLLRIMLQTYGSLAYIGQGWQGACTEGMNRVNGGDINYFFKKEHPIKWGEKILGVAPADIQVPGMTKVGAMNAFDQCIPDPNKGYLYIFDNRAWNKNASVTDVPNMLEEVAKLKEAKQYQQRLKNLQMLNNNLGGTPAMEMMDPPNMMQTQQAFGELTNAFQGGPVVRKLDGDVLV